jgi:isopentenyl-diphosphate delta-isomerase
MINNAVVSFDDEMLILVDENDNVIDYKSKIECHQGDGILHRAFSIFIFNSKMEVIMQKRSDNKMLWPMFWSNTCCSHPRKGEVMEEAAHRRLSEEIGFDTRLEYLYKFIYQANYKAVGAENELCSVFIGKSDEQVVVNENEIADWKFISIPDLSESVAEKPDEFTPWFKKEWELLTTKYLSGIENL